MKYTYYPPPEQYNTEILFHVPVRKNSFQTMSCQHSRVWRAAPLNGTMVTTGNHPITFFANDIRQSKPANKKVTRSAYPVCLPLNPARIVRYKKQKQNMKHNNQKDTKQADEIEEIIMIPQIVREAPKTHRRRRRQTRYLNKISNDPLVMNA